MNQGRDTVRRAAAGYVRVSTGSQPGSGAGVPRQVAHLQTWCAANDVDLTAVYKDNGVSGAGEDRPGFQALMDAATIGERRFDIVLVSSLSRLTRDVGTLAKSMNRLRNAGVALISVDDPVSHDATGSLFPR